MRSYWLLGLLAGLSLAGCRTGPPHRTPTPVVGAVAADAVARVRTWASTWPVYAADFLFEEALVDDMGGAWSVYVPLASRRNYKPSGALFHVSKADGAVTPVPLR